MTFEESLRQYIDEIDLDIRKKPEGYSRYMDQKVTPDVLTFIADCIVNFLGGKDPQTVFTIKDIWDFEYFQKNTIAIFGKPSPTNKKAQSEYDKFIAQPLKTLAFAKILKENKVGTSNTYRVIQPELLEHVAQSERKAWLFVVMYLEKVMSDSGFLELENYKNKVLTGSATINDFNSLKDKFKTFTRGYTNINGDVEINRIFPKILNPYAAYYMINGSIIGRMSKNRFTYSDLSYNRVNFRDVGKDKSITRRESGDVIDKKPELSAYKSQKAKNIIRRNHTTSEVHDSLSKGEATQVHHIFPEHQFPQVSTYLENLILLTPHQHNTKAHPSNHTQKIDRNYQIECVLSKIESIESSLNNGKDIYSKELLIHVINIGFSVDLSTKTTFEELRTFVNKLQT
ncbi:MAG: hypothetical protein HQ491_03600 [Bacteroidetes bacterium]|nr:hypothetical protein [Bacteroidota bacterium]